MENLLGLIQVVMTILFCVIVFGSINFLYSLLHNRNTRPDVEYESVSIGNFVNMQSGFKSINQDVINDDCIICSEILNNKDMILLKCSHIQHKECLVQQVNKTNKKNCPLCRTKLNIDKLIITE